MKTFRTMLILFGVLAAVAVMGEARSPQLLLLAMERGDAGTAALELSLGATLDRGPIPLGLRSEVIEIIAATGTRGPGRDRAALGAFAVSPPTALLSDNVHPAAAAALAAPVLFSAAELYGDTPLMAAARCGNCRQVVLLLAAGADPSFRHPLTGATALDVASTSGHLAAAGMLAAFATGLGRPVLSD